jgi:hypothetical protein
MNNLQEKMESDFLGRTAISCLIVLFLATMLAFNLPRSRLQHRLAPLGGPLRNGLGFDQAWGVFAPKPPTTVTELFARIRYDDGAKEIWRWPKGDPLISEYRAYHWEKWAEQAMLDEHRDLWRPLAEWLARTRDRRDRHPVEISLFRRSFALKPPGTHPSRGPATEETFFTFRVDASVLASGTGR